MKYKKIVLSPNTLGLMYDRLNRFMKAGLVTKQFCFTSYGPTYKNLNFEKFPIRMCVYTEPAEIHTGLIIFRNYHEDDLVFSFGTTFFLSNDEILFKIDGNKVIRYKLLRSRIGDSLSKLYGVSKMI